MTTPDFSGETTTPSQGILSDVSALVDSLRLQERTIADIEARLLAAQAVYNRLVLTDIPEAMEQLQMTELKLTDGAKLTIRDDINAYIPADNKAEAMQWFTEHNLGSIIKRAANVDMRALTDEQLQAFNTFAEENEMEVTIAESIHAATLKATVKDMLARGVTPPPLISVHQFKKAVLKEPK
jgi:hypothetical protein